MMDQVSTDKGWWHNYWELSLKKSNNVAC